MSFYSTIGCGLVQAHYAFANVSHKSFTTVKYFIKMLSSTSDAIIFLFSGMVLVNDVHANGTLDSSFGPSFYVSSHVSLLIIFKF